MAGVGNKEPLGRSLLTKQIPFWPPGSTDVLKDSAFLDVGPTVGEGSCLIRVPLWKAESQWEEARKVWVHEDVS